MWEKLNTDISSINSIYTAIQDIRSVYVASSKNEDFSPSQLMIESLVLSFAALIEEIAELTLKRDHMWHELMCHCAGVFREISQNLEIPVVLNQLPSIIEDAIEIPSVALNEPLMTILDHTSVESRDEVTEEQNEYKQNEYKQKIDFMNALNPSISFSPSGTVVDVQERHRHGTCTPCKFFFEKGKCSRAEACSYCHHPDHQPEHLAPLRGPKGNSEKNIPAINVPLLHFIGECRPCRHLFSHRATCMLGEKCGFCHDTIHKNMS